MKFLLFSVLLSLPLGVLAEDNSYLLVKLTTFVPATKGDESSIRCKVFKDRVETSIYSNGMSLTRTRPSILVGNVVEKIDKAAHAKIIVRDDPISLDQGGVSYSGMTLDHYAFVLKSIWGGNVLKQNVAPETVELIRFIDLVCN